VHVHTDDIPDAEPSQLTGGVEMGGATPAAVLAFACAQPAGSAPPGRRAPTRPPEYGMRKRPEPQ
jgi:hypothetical protein